MPLFNHVLTFVIIMLHNDIFRTLRQNYVDMIGIIVKEGKEILKKKIQSLPNWT